MKENLMKTVAALEGFRDGEYGYEKLCEAAGYIEAQFRSLGFEIDKDDFDFNGKPYRNIIASPSGMDSGTEWIAVCAHYDAVAGSPGADDNASGVAVMLEAARILGKRAGLKFIHSPLKNRRCQGLTSSTAAGISLKE